VVFPGILVSDDDVINGVHMYLLLMNPFILAPPRLPQSRLPGKNWRATCLEYISSLRLTLSTVYRRTHQSNQARAKSLPKWKSIKNAGHPLPSCRCKLSVEFSTLYHDTIVNCLDGERAMQDEKGLLSMQNQEKADHQCYASCGGYIYLFTFVR